MSVWHAAMDMVNAVCREDKIVNEVFFSYFLILHSF